MKIIHCADLHLDSKMESNLSAQKAKERREEIFETFAAMVDYAEKNGVRAVIIAGDMFDTKNSHIRIKNRVRDVISAAEGIDFLYLKGNHDNSDFLGGAPCPDNLKFFGQDWTHFSYGNIDIAGCEGGENKHNSLSLDENRINIVVLHGQEASGNAHGDNIINIPEFANRYIDYLALGHIHSYKCAKLDERGIYCYCGCLEGRGFDECGEKGFVLLDVDETGVRHEFIPFAKRMLHTVSVRLDGVMTSNELIERIGAAVSHIPQKDMVKIVLEGEIDEQTDIDIVYLGRRYEDTFYFVKIYDHTALLINYESYKNDISLKGEFIRLVNAQDIDEERKKTIILTGLRALSGREIDI